jgi:hypothetical protein
MSSLATESSLSRAPTIEQRPKNQAPADIPLSPNYFVFDDWAMGNNQMQRHRTREILFTATLLDQQGNAITNWSTIERNDNQYTLVLPEQVLYTRYTGEAEYEVPMAPSPYEGHQTSGEIRILKRSDDEEVFIEWTHIISDNEQDKHVLDRNTNDAPQGDMNGRILRQANVQEVVTAPADVVRAGGPVNVANLTPWHDIKF